MTAVIHHGPPGSFKSFSIVQRVMIPALQSGRVVVTNIRGFNDLDRIAKAMGIQFPDSARIMYVSADTEEGFQYIARFFHWAPAGALIVIDEGQRAYPTRTKSLTIYDQPDNIPLHLDDGSPLLDADGKPIFRPATLENAFDQHRHCNWDIYISTPNIAKIHKEIRGVVEWAYRHRDFTGLNPFSKKSKWREFKHDAESTGKSVSHYFGTPATYTADKRVFACYQSTKTGKAKRSNENISIFRDRKLQAAIVLVIASAAWFISQVGEVYDRFAGNPAPLPSIPVETPVALSGPVAQHDSGHAGHSVHRPTAVAHDNPLGAYTLYYVGRINSTLLFVAQADDDRFINLDGADLEQLGYQVAHVGNSFVRLSLADRSVYAWPPHTTPSNARSNASARDGDTEGAL